MRLIDADALAQVFMGLTIVSPEVMNYANAVTVAIANAPTIEAEPVRHGKWVLCEGFRICNGCGASPADWEPKPNNPLGLPPYCHSCGAKMDLEG